MAVADAVGGEELHWYLADELEQVPNRPGLYAWYFVPLAGPLDWAEFIDDQSGSDLGVARFGDFLARHTDRVRLPGLSLRARGHLGADWLGRLDDQSSLTLAQNLRSLADGGPGRGASVRWALTNADARECLAQVLLSASPRLSPPIYIGVAKNLRGRLDEHMRDYGRAMAQPDDDGDLPSKFGERAAAAGLRVDELKVAVLPISELENLDDDELRKVAEAAEFVLNRWHRPMLGQR